MWGIVEPLQSILKAVLSMPNTSTQHNSNYVVFSDSGKSLAISPLLEVWARTRQNTETVSERVPTRTAREQRGKIIKAVRKPRRSMNEAREKKTKNWTPNKLRGSQERTEGEQWKMSVYSVQIRAFLGVFCVRYIIILPMPLQRRTEPQRATTTHSESSVIIPLYSYFKNQQKTAKMIDRYSGIWYNGSLNNTFFLLLVSRKRFKGCGETSPPSRFC